MIKKIFKSLLTFGIIGLGIINFSNAFSYDISNGYYLVDVEGIPNTGNPYDYTVSNTLDFLMGPGFNQFIFVPLNDAYGNPKMSIGLFWYNDRLYFMGGGRPIYQTFIQGFYSKYCHSSGYTSLYSDCLAGYDTVYTNSHSPRFDINIFYQGFDPSNFEGLYFISRNTEGSWVDYTSAFCIYHKDSSIDCFLGLTGSLDFPITNGYLNIEDLQNISGIQSSPYIGGGGININTGSYAGNSGNYISVDCTNGSVKNRYQSIGYKTYLCYGGEKYRSSGNYSTQMLIPGTGYNVFEIYNYMSGAIGTGNTYSTGNSIDDWFNYWRSQYGWWTNQYVSTDNPFVGNPRILFGLFDFVSRYGPSYDSKAILDYCNLLINADGSQVYTGRYAGALRCNGNKNGQVDLVYNPGNDGTGGNSDDIGGLSSSWSGTFLGVGSGSLGSGQVYSFSTFLTNFYNTVSGVFNGLVGFETRVGFIPRYIVATMLFLILFRFLSH